MSLKTSHLSVGYGSTAVLTDVNVEAGAGTLTALLGANGAGKSTLLRTMIGVQPALGGEALLDGRPIGDFKSSERARRLSVVFTDRTGGGGLTVEQLVAIGRHAHTGITGRLAPADREAVDSAIDMVGMTRKARAFVSTLSDGERQKVMIARAVAQQAGVMVLDEPTSFLDVAARYDIIDLLSRIAASGTAVVLSTHDVAAALTRATHIWAVSQGTVTGGQAARIIGSGVMDTIYEGVCFDASSGDFRPCR